MRHLVALVSLLLLASLAGADEPTRLRPDRTLIEIERDTVLQSGDWLVPGREGESILIVHADGVTLDLGGATLRGAAADVARDGLVGIGILVENAKGVTIQNGTVAGFKVGVRAVNAPGLVIEDVDASGGFRQRLKSTPEREDASDWLWPHHNDEGEWESRYGAAISLNDCAGATVRRCTARHGQNGLLLTRCTKCFAYDNDFSFNSGWGVGMYRTTHTEVSHNRLDFCVRGYSHDVYYRGQDSAAILVFEQCSHNVFVHNSATHSGDGLFLYAGHETTQRTGKGGSNHNQVYANDFRYAVANGIEATFSEGNEFVGNDCSGSDHGIWAGYSYRSAFLGNRIRRCMTAGISIEHGHHNPIYQNDIEGARYGVHLWWDEDRQFLEGVYGKTQDCTSSHNEVKLNRLHGTEAALRIAGDTDSTLDYNAFRPGPSTVEIAPGSRWRSFTGNAFETDVTVENTTGAPLELPGTNGIGGTLHTRGDPVRRGEARTPPPFQPSPLPPMPEVKGSRDVGFPRDLPEGREQMRIDEWGPLDPRETVLLPARQAAPGSEARVHLLGGAPFRVTSLTKGVVATPMEGTAPATILLKASAEGPVLEDFRIEVSSDGKTLSAEGTLTRLAWNVGFFEWGAAEHPIEKPEAFGRLLEGEAKTTAHLPGLDFPWQGGGPEGVRSDGFATVARASVQSPVASRVRLRVVSDDGVRVEVNKKTVIERWDRHGPTEDVVEVDLVRGANSILVTHFELDGWAWLSFRVEAVD